MSAEYSRVQRNCLPGSRDDSMTKRAFGSVDEPLCYHAVVAGAGVIRVPLKLVLLLSLLLIAVLLTVGFVNMTTGLA